MIAAKEVMRPRLIASDSKHQAPDGGITTLSARAILNFLCL
jgi:hypothetical protein